MRSRRIGRIVAAALVATFLMVGTPAVASADPGGNPVYCGGWSHGFGFRFRACVEFRTTRVDHRLEVQYLGSGTVGLYYSGSDYRVGDYWGDCTEQWGDSFYSGQSRSYYCSTARISGYNYQTRGTIGDDSGLLASSPVITG